MAIDRQRIDRCQGFEIIRVVSRWLQFHQLTSEAPSFVCSVNDVVEEHANSNIPSKFSPHRFLVPQKLRLHLRRGVQQGGPTLDIEELYQGGKSFKWKNL